MTKRLRERAGDADPVMARAAALMGSAPSIEHSTVQRDRVARRIAAAGVGHERTGLRRLAAACAVALLAGGALAAWRESSRPRDAIEPAAVGPGVLGAPPAIPTVRLPRMPSAPSASQPADPAPVPTDAPARPEDILWANDHEQGALAKWNQGNSAELGGTYAVRGARVSVTTAQAHSGERALAFTGDTSTGRDVTARVYRNGFLPEEGYYSAWYLVPRRYVVGEYWSLGMFRKKGADGQATGHGDPVFGLNLVSDAATGEMFLKVWNATAKDSWHQDRPQPIPVGTWFHVEIFLRATADGTGQLVLWQDGREVLRRDVPQIPAGRWMNWAIGSSARRLSPPGGVLYVDDVAVSRTRLGPGAPAALYRDHE